MNHIETMKQALEALEIATTPLAKDRQEVLKAREALRAAIEQAEKQEPVLVKRERETEQWLRSKDWSEIVMRIHELKDQIQALKYKLWKLSLKQQKKDTGT